MLEKDLEG